MPNLKWENKRVSIDKLKPAAYNPRTASPKQFSDVTKSLEKFDLADPIVINRDNTIIGGHLRIQALKKKGITDVDVRIPTRQLNPREEKELNLRLNKNVGEWNLELLGNGHFGKELLGEVGFGNDELAKIFDLDIQEDNFDADKAYNKIIKPQTKPGQIYQLGDHRLMCGDSSDPECWEKLMDGAKADLIFTDPPYNVGYDYWSFRGTRKKGFTSKKMFNDKRGPEEFQKFIHKVFLNLFNNARDSAPFYCWHSSSQQEFFRGGLQDAGWHISQTLIWLKNSLVLSPGQDYHRMYEPCYFGWKKGQRHFINKKVGTNWTEIELMEFSNFASLLDVLYEHRDKTSEYKHPTQKPIKLAQRALKRHSLPGHIIVDAFGGSGSTMIGAHQLDRPCYSMELDPKFCDVIVERYNNSISKAVDHRAR